MKLYLIRKVNSPYFVRWICEGEEAPILTDVKQYAIACTFFTALRIKRILEKRSHKNKYKIERIKI